VRDPRVGGERPKGRKAAKRRLKENANNPIADLVTTQMNSLTSTNVEMSQVFKEFLNKSNEDKYHKRMIREQKLRIQEDRIMMMDNSTMAQEQVAYIECKTAEILQRKLGDSSST